ncbi:MAG: hypothetical protein ACW99A_05300 [Candidatus Kariarchaeaceae archaeon]|jgi:hypothetical protein
MKKIAQYYIIAGVIFTFIGIGIMLILYGIYLYRNAGKWEKEPTRFSYSEPGQVTQEEEE